MKITAKKSWRKPSIAKTLPIKKTLTGLGNTTKEAGATGRYKWIS